MRRLLITPALLLTCIYYAPVAQGDGENPTGGDLAWKYHCSTCHGESGQSNSSRYPNVAGLPAPYLESRLRYFRSQAEPGNKMNAQAVLLTDADIATLAEHYSAMPAPARPGGASPELVIEKGCVACHGSDGVATAPIYPNLRGQWTQYLRIQLRAYRSGKRDNAIMNGFAATLTDEEIRELAAHYGTR